MSYPTANKLNPTTATEKEMIEVFKSDLPLGWNILTDMVKKLKEGSEDHAWARRQPSSEEGKQLIRIFGYDVPRRVVEKHFDIKMGMLNCCKVVIASSEAALTPHLTIEMQIKEQNGEHASADC
ncbi:hypothetical protein GF376_02115 [Candidatus Peregrinibacteria bacterium]|nr:hypothetical protein [Candidatus Peregrinibacteria bacterium]